MKKILALVLIYFLMFELIGFVFYEFKKSETTFPNATLNLDSRLSMQELREKAYANADFATDEFYKESFTPDPYLKNGLIYNQDFKGKWINVINGIRTTSFSPDRFKQKVYVFGGSTVICLEVPDQYTFPSYLQKMLNHHKENHFKVLNYGYVGASLKTQNNKLTEIIKDIAPNDIVIYFIGFNDAMRFWLGDKDRNSTDEISSIVNRFLKRERNLDREMRFLESLKYKPYSIKAILLWYKINRYSFPAKDFDYLNEVEFEKFRNDFEADLKYAHDLSIKKKFKLFSFFQPTIFTLGRPRSDFENKVLRRTEETWAKMSLIEKPLNYYRNIFNQKYAKEYPGIFFDLSYVFDSKNENEEFYLDMVHVSQVGNERIAKEMYKKINPYLIK